jgi:hypothetical protein
MSRLNSHTHIKPTDWNALRDALVLALDAVGERPEEVDALSLAHIARHQKAAMRIVGRALAKAGGAA